MNGDEQEKQRQREQAQAWLQDKWRAPNKECPICLVNTWTVTEVSELRPFAGGGLVVGGGVFPIFQLICNNCGYTLLFNAGVAGVVKEEPEGRSEAETAPKGVEP